MQSGAEATATDVLSGVRNPDASFNSVADLAHASQRMRVRLLTMYNPGSTIKFREALGCFGRVLAYVTGTVDQELLLQNEYLATEKPDPEKADQGSAAAFGRRKSNTSGDRSPPGSKGAGGRGGNGQARNDSGLVWKAHRKQI